MEKTNSKIKVLHLRDSKGLYGAERVIFALGRLLNGKLFDCSLMCMKNRDGKSDPLIAKAVEAGIKVFPVEMTGRFDLRAIRQMRRVLKKEKISIIHSHDYKSDLYGLLASAGSGIKRVSTAHGSTRDSLLKELYLLMDEHLVYRFFHAIIAVSDDIAEYLNKCGIRPQSIHVVPNGLDFGDMSAVDATREIGVELRDHKVFGIIGRLFPDKGHRFFLEALARVVEEFPTVAALVVGDGPTGPEIRQQIEELGLQDNVFMCGFRTDMRSVYNRLDFLVMPSLREGLPYTLLEAMYYRVPLLATAVGEVPRIIEDGVTGRLVKPADVEGLYAGMTEMLADQHKAKEWAEKAHQLLMKQYSAEKMVRETEKVYMGLIP